MVGWWKKRVNSSSPWPFLINTTVGILMINQVHSGPDTPPLTITMPEIPQGCRRARLSSGVLAARGEALAGVGQNDITITIKLEHAQSGRNPKNSQIDG